MLPLARVTTTPTARLFWSNVVSHDALFTLSGANLLSSLYGAGAVPHRPMLPGFSNCNRFAAKRTFKSSTTAPTAANDSSVGVDVQAVVGLADGGRLGAKAELRRYRTVVPAPERLVVVGDVHGDIAALRSCLRMADLIDANDRWAGGDTVVVQVGDIFDRGDDDLRIEEWVHLLAQDAENANGAIYSILGNHEVMNAAGDHSMATRKAFVPFDDLWPELDEMVGGDWSELEGFPPWARCRVLAMRPGGPVAKLMSAHAVCMKVGDNLFVHAGLRPAHFGQAEDVGKAEEAMERMNAGVASWMLGGKVIPAVLFGEESPVWTRVYSSPDSRDIDEAARAELEEVLQLTGTKRMLVGHTPQRSGINSAADGQIWRVDTGMTAMIGGRPEVLEIKGDEITVLTEYKALPALKRACRPLPPPAEMEELRRQ